mmetsp:Transcript_83113/g.258036  ORF Transcript_83113/g.258036 Transcript_83113/m.258036 type:complete len:210 (+) Transcript_83113:299-928(+)
MQMRPPGMSDAPYGAGAAVLMEGLRPSAGAEGLEAGALGSTSKPSAAAAAMPFCAKVGPLGSAGATPGVSMFGRALRPAAGAPAGPGAGRARRPLLLGCCGAPGGTMMVRLGLLEALLLRFFGRPGLGGRGVLLRFLLRRPRLRERLLGLLLPEELERRLRFFFFFFWAACGSPPASASTSSSSASSSTSASKAVSSGASAISEFEIAV